MHVTAANTHNCTDCLHSQPYVWANIDTQPCCHCGLQHQTQVDEPTVAKPPTDTTYPHRCTPPYHAGSRIHGMRAQQAAHARPAAPMHTHARTHARTLARSPARPPTRTHARSHARTHTGADIDTDTKFHSRTHGQAQNITHRRMRTCMHTRTRTHTHAHAHTHTRTHTL